MKVSAIEITGMVTWNLYFLEPCNLGTFKFLVEVWIIEVDEWNVSIFSQITLCSTVLTRIHYWVESYILLYEAIFFMKL